jgi:hypothetical protein
MKQERQTKTGQKQNAFSTHEHKKKTTKEENTSNQCKHLYGYF